MIRVTTISKALILFMILIATDWYMEEEFVKSKGALICTQTFGTKGNPTVILSAGATVSMLFWDEDFCRQLAAQGFFVIRYDNRDVGKSTYYTSDTLPYDIVDLADDAIAILDHYKIEKAHFFGMSLGGLVAQIAALKHSKRVESLILMSTGPWAEADASIPAMDSRIITFQAKASEVDWTNEEDVVQYLLSGARLMTGRKDFDAKRAERQIRNEYRRANHYMSMFNHAKLAGGEEYYNQLQNIQQPALIIHGTDDLIWHFNYAQVLRSKLPHSSLLVLEGTGHELHEQDWAAIIKQGTAYMKALAR